MRPPIAWCINHRNTCKGGKDPAVRGGNCTVFTGNKTGSLLAVLFRKDPERGHPVLRCQVGVKSRRCADGRDRDDGIIRIEVFNIQHDDLIGVGKGFLHCFESFRQETASASAEEQPSHEGLPAGFFC